MRSLPMLAFALLVPFAPLAAHADPVMWSGTGNAGYLLVHKFHEVEGKSTKIQTKAVWDGDQIKVQARGLVDSFVSGDASRDAHMLEVMEAEKFPFVMIRGVIGGVAVPTGALKVDTTLKADVELHGQTVSKDVPVTLDFADPTHVTVSFSFPESLEGHGIERPSLLFVKVDDDIKITGSIPMERKP